jgi:hypothetical protein
MDDPDRTVKRFILITAIPGDEEIYGMPTGGKVPSQIDCRRHDAIRFREKDIKSKSDVHNV